CVIRILPASCSQVNKWCRDAAQIARVKKNTQFTVHEQLGSSRGAVYGKGYVVPAVVQVVSFDLYPEIVISESKQAAFESQEEMVMRPAQFISLAEPVGGQCRVALPGVALEPERYCVIHLIGDGN